MKQELINEIIQMLIKEGCYRKEMQSELEIILSEYEVDKRHTEVMVINEDDNQMLIRRFITAKIVKGLSDRTLEYYKNTIDQFIDRMQKNIADVTADDIRLYIALRRKKDGVTDTTAGNELRNLRTFYNWLYTEEIIASNPISKVEPIKQKKTKKEAFSEYEIELIRNECRTSRETAMVEILLSTGCRVNELAHIKKTDIKNDSILVHGKGDKDRIVYLNAKAQIALERYMSEREDKSEYIFPKCSGNIKDKRINSVKRNWYKYKDMVANEPSDVANIETTVRRIGNRAGVKNTHPHRFRRTCATFALRRGMPIEQVSKMLGHEQISTTQIYLDLAEEELEQAHKKYVV